MAYILRSLAIIGVIALNSPVLSSKEPEDGVAAGAKRLAQSATRIDLESASRNLSAARETAQVLAGLEPETRRRLLEMALPTGSLRNDVPATTHPPRMR
jgi:hypothetical protein